MAYEKPTMNRKLIGHIDLNYQGNIIPNVTVFEITGQRVFKNEVKNFHYYTTEEIPSHNINANYLRLYQNKKTPWDIEKEVLPLMSGQTIERIATSNKTGNPYKQLITWDPEKPGLGGSYSGGLDYAFGSIDNDELN